MSPFDIVSILLFITLIIIQVAYFFIMKRSKNFINLINNYENVKSELVDIINDAEQMVYELNEMSDYIVRQMDLKNIELQSNLKNAEEQLNDIARKSNSLQLKMKMQTYSIDMAREDCEIVDAEAQDDVCRENKTGNGNAIPINHRYTDVLKLFKEGFDESEIARNLKIGKGEVRLILGLNKE